MQKSFFKNIFKNFNTIKPIYKGIEKTAPISSLVREAETVIVGGGLLGLSTALELGEAGHDTVLLEAKKIGEGASGRSGGQVWPGYDMYLSEMREVFGDELTKQAWDLNYEILKTFHKRISTREDRCDFSVGLIIASKTEAQKKWIEEEFKVFQEFGLSFASYLSKEDITKKYIATDFYLNGILYQGEETGRQYGHVNPLKYTQTVAVLAQEKGVRLVENCPVEVVEPLPDGRYLLTTRQGTIMAKNIVFATGVNFLRPKGISYNIIPRTNIPVEGVILATESISSDLVKEIIPSGVCFADASEIAMNFVSLIPDPDNSEHYRLTFGGADALMQAEVEFEIPKIEKEMYTMFPQLAREGVTVEKIWGGTCDLSRNAIPAILHPQKGIFHVSGFSGQGMVNTALYGSAVADKILGRHTGKFELLEKLNPKMYSSIAIVAWLQAGEQVAQSKVR